MPYIQLRMPYTSSQPSTTTPIAICNITPMKMVHGSMRPSPTPRKTKGMILSWLWTAMAISMSLTTVMMVAAICDYRVESTVSGKTRPLPVPSTLETLQTSSSTHKIRFTLYHSISTTSASTCIPVHQVVGRNRQDSPEETPIGQRSMLIQTTLYTSRIIMDPLKKT